MNLKTEAEAEAEAVDRTIMPLGIKSRSAAAPKCFTS
jgi:hypothetical protein